MPVGYDSSTANAEGYGGIHTTQRRIEILPRQEELSRSLASISYVENHHDDPMPVQCTHGKARATSRGTSREAQRYQEQGAEAGWMVDD